MVVEVVVVAVVVVEVVAEVVVVVCGDGCLLPVACCLLPVSIAC